MVGLMFMMSSKKMRKAEGWAWFAGLLAVGLLISFIFYSFGGRGNPVMVILYFIFFMAHGYRDVVFFYQPSTDDRDLERTRSRILWFIQACLLIVLTNILVPAYLFYRSLRPKTYTPELKAQIDSLMPYLYAILVLSWLCFVTPQQETSLARPRPVFRARSACTPPGFGCARLATLAFAPPHPGGVKADGRKTNYRKIFTPPLGFRWSVRYGFNHC